jgi:hypothetical protein
VFESIKRISRTVMVLSLLVFALGRFAQSAHAQIPGLDVGITQGQTITVPKPPFAVRSYGGKCLEFGVPRTIAEQSMAKNYPVFISDCQGTAVQKVSIEELPGEGHLVVLRAGNGVIGKKQVLSAAQGEVSSFTTADQTPVEVQPYTGSPGQIFAIDGDSMILVADRNLVIEVQNNRGANGTPLVLGRRDLADSEFWTFTATDGSHRRPTSGFQRVPADHNPYNDAFEFAQAVENAKAGAVIEVAPDASIELTGEGIILIPKGVTIRGDRRGTRLGPELWTKPHGDTTMLEITADDVRITGLRLRGPTSSTDGDGPNSRGIVARDYYLRSIIDHNEISNWPLQAVYVDGDPAQPPVCWNPWGPGDRRGPRPLNVRVVRNFIHHNQRYEKGYGVQAHYGAYVLIEGNTFVSNRHAIAADGEGCTSYLAYYNLVLSRAPEQHKLGWAWYTHDFDVHGTGDNGFGWYAGEYFEIVRNTFLGTNRENFDLRGEPRREVHFSSNISLRIEEHAVGCTDCGGGSDKLYTYNNQFSALNPTHKLGVGDFDGDGIDDLFLATGAAWYYSSAANAEWRFLNARTEKIDGLLFGDFDGDGHTDVFTQHGMNWDISWGGASKWEKINQSTEPMSGYHIGDFDGDHRADVFYANGHEWFISSGGVGIFTHFAFSTCIISDLRFGDFNGDGKTDVFGVGDRDWMVVYGGTNYWVPLRARSTNSVVTLTVADFNGDGRADVASQRRVNDALIWDISLSGTGESTNLRTGTLSLNAPVAIGRFDNSAGADVLFWNSVNYLALDIILSGRGAAILQSLHDMR